LYQSANYTVKVDGNSCFVYETDDYWANSPASRPDTAAFACFSFQNESVTVEVTCNFTADAVLIRPKSDHVSFTKNGNKITFTLTEPKKLCVEVNNRNRPLFIFADEPDTPDTTAHHYFGPGVHYIGARYAVAPNERVYIAGGAVVEGTLQLQGDDIKVRGRGVLCAGQWTWEAWQLDKSLSIIWNTGWHNDHEYSGIVLANSPGWNVNGCGHRRILRNLKVVAWVGMTDGPHTSGNNSLLEDTFLFTNDDVLMTSYGANSVIRNCVVWKGPYGRPMGSLNGGDDVNADCLWEDIDVIGDEGIVQNSSAMIACFRIHGSGVRGPKRNFIFRDIRIEEPRRAPLLYFNADSFEMENITLENITAEGHKDYEGLVRAGGTGWVDGVHFKSVVLGGEVIASLADAHISVSGAVSDVTFDASGPRTVSVRIDDGANDAEERLDTHQVFLGSSDLELVRDASNQLVGMRFPAINIPQGAIVEGARLEFQTDEADSEPTALVIQAQASDNAAGFTTAPGNLSGRPRTVALVRWEPDGWSTIGKLRRTPDLSAVVQELVGRAGWHYGNALVLLVSGSGRRTAESYEGDATGAPLLTVRYRVRAFSAYNDLAWYSGQADANVTKWSRSQVGNLVAHESGATLGATLSLDSGGSGPQTYGANAQTNTDASDVFGGIVDCAGTIGYGTEDLTLSFSALEAGPEYELVLFGNRDNSGYTDRLTRFTIGGIDAFRNTSSGGAFFSGATDPSTVIINGYNTVNGCIARFAGIEPGTNGAFTVTVWDDDSVAAPKWYVNALRLKASEPAGSELLIAKETVWKYEASGTDLGTAWRALGYPDAGWSEGQGPLGHGTDWIETDVPYGPDPTDKYMTTYFRRHLFLAQPPPPNTRVLLRARYDDGFVAYLNGEEITRQAMPSGTIDFNTAAASHSSTTYEEIDLSVHVGKLTAGENMLAVEVHQRAPNSTDLCMDMELVLLAAEGPIDLAVVEKGAVWRYRRGSAEVWDPATAWRRTTFDDSAWPSGAAPFGYSTDPSEGPFGTELADMRYVYPSVFLRHTFLLDQPLLVGRLVLDADHDDGFIVWINGQEIVRPNMSGPPGGFVPCTAQYAPLGSIEPTPFSIVLTGGQLPELAHTNLIAVQVFNYGLTSSDLVFDLGLAATTYALSAAEDADRDGMPDDWEQAWLSQLSDPSDRSAQADPDNDGLCNLAEYIAGTDPNDETANLKLETLLSGGQLEIRLQTIAASGAGYDGLARHYALEQRGSLVDDSMWLAVPGYEDVTATGQLVTYTHSTPTIPLLFRARVWLEE